MGHFVVPLAFKGVSQIFLPFRKFILFYDSVLYSVEGVVDLDVEVDGFLVDGIEWNNKLRPGMTASGDGFSFEMEQIQQADKSHLPLTAPSES